MKRIVFLTLALFVLQACSKKNDAITPADNTPPLPAGNDLPTSFVQRVLLETFTGTWCSTCPDADYKRDQIVSTYSGKVISITIHNNDSMAIPAYTWYFSTFGTGIPSGMVSRIPSLGNVVLNSNQWLSNTTAALSRTAKCGLSISSSISGSNANLDIKAGFIEDFSSGLTLNVYLVEDNITGTGTGYSQANGFNTITGSPFYNQGNPINSYVHNRVVRKSVTPNGGEAIPASSTIKNSIFAKSYSISLSGINTSNSYVVAFINKTGASSTTHEILNVQQVKLGQTVSWN
ncbi:MAG: Omp28-related outer membrane protein [Bacteroidia bacterium]|nr:Omp28-related outer membrane protein [Bacteroidia bacterium]